MLYVREAQGSIEEVTKKLEAAAIHNKFGVVGFRDLKQTMNAEGSSSDGSAAFWRSAIQAKPRTC